MPALDKAQIVAALEEMAVLMTIDGANTFRVRAFENGARALETADIDLAAAVAAGSLGDIKGLGKSLVEMIVALHTEGTHPDLEQLRAEIPATVAEMTRIPGFGPKKAALVYAERGIASIDQLEAAIAAGELADLKGFGAKTIENIREGIAYVRQNVGRFRIDRAREAALPILAMLRALPPVEAAEAAGSLRRWRESVHDIDFLVATQDPKAVMEAFVGVERVEKVLAHGETKSSLRLVGGLQVDCRCVAPVEFPHALQHFTGSKEHNVALRARARKMGLKMSEWGYFPLDAIADDDAGWSDAAKAIYCADEDAVYAKLGLAFIVPEQREGLGEIERAAAAHERGEPMPPLLERGHLRGILHCHSTYSDGKSTLEEMARATHALGMEYLGICDHSKAAAYAHGLTPDRVRRQWDEVDKLNERFATEMGGFRLLKGIEADILPSGDLDFHDDGDLLDGFEFVVASVHSGFTLSRDDQTHRMLRALDDPRLTILGHPTGRLVLARAGYEVDVEALMERAAAGAAAIEINASPHRLDLDWRHGSRARELGLLTAICPDSHHTSGLTEIDYGVGIARKAGFGPERVLNARSADDFLAFAAARRARG